MNYLNSLEASYGEVKILAFKGGTSPCIFKVNKPGIQGSLQHFTHQLIKDFPSFLLGLASNTAFTVFVG